MPATPWKSFQVELESDFGQLFQLVGLREKLQENLIFHDKLYGFLYIDGPLSQTTDCYPIASPWLLRSLPIDYVLLASVALSVTLKSDHEPFQR